MVSRDRRGETLRCCHQHQRCVFCSRPPPANYLHFTFRYFFHSFTSPAPQVGWFMKIQFQFLSYPCVGLVYLLLFFSGQCLNLLFVSLSFLFKLFAEGIITRFQSFYSGTEKAKQKIMSMKQCETIKFQFQISLENLYVDIAAYPRIRVTRTFLV